MKFIKSLKKKFNKKNVNKILNKIDKEKVKNILFMVIPFLILELSIFIIGIKISYVNNRIFGPLLFTISWLTLFIGISLSLKKKIGKFIYLFFNILFLVLFLVQGIYFSIMSKFFDFSLVESASEGAPYILHSLTHTNILVYLVAIITIFFMIKGYKKIPNKKENNYKSLVIVIIVFLFLHTLAPFTLGKANKDLTWSSWRNARNIYNSFNDCNKSIKVSGFFEFEFRNFYVTFLKTKEQMDAEDIEFLDSSFTEKTSSKNKYTGKFKDKNLIIVQLEGTDKWLINKKDTPTLYKMMNEGINFDKHYSFYCGGGSTFNSEFAVNTGFSTPFSYTKNAYSFNKNDFPFTLAKTFKNNGYSVNAFHMNSGEYYSRNVNYSNWGYDHYYGLKDLGKYTDKSYMLDRNLILNEEFNKLMFPEEGKFLDYIITYSGHVPFTNTEDVCKMLYEEDVQKQEEKGIKTEFRQMSEEECVRRQAKETDYMIKLLVQNLQEKNLIDNTVLIIFTDHYLYTLSDQSILDKYKNTSNNLINNTPWFIWSNDIKKEKITKVTSQLNILPTILDLFGYSYNVNNYIGESVFAKNYSNIAFFSDYSWYDGHVYVENGEVKNKKKISNRKLEEKNQYVNYLTKKNDLALKYNYFNKESSD